jgi:hypothetical protein
MDFALITGKVKHKCSATELSGGLLNGHRLTGLHSTQPQKMPMSEHDDISRFLVAARVSTILARLHCTGHDIRRCR